MLLKCKYTSVEQPVHWLILWTRNTLSGYNDIRSADFQVHSVSSWKYDKMYKYFRATDHIFLSYTTWFLNNICSLMDNCNTLVVWIFITPQLVKLITGLFEPDSVIYKLSPNSSNIAECVINDKQNKMSTSEKYNIYPTSHLSPCDCMGNV